MSETAFTVVLASFFVLGVLETLAPRRMDGLMGKVLGSAYEQAASERSRLRWIRLNGLFLLALCMFMSFALVGSS